MPWILPFGVAGNAIRQVRRPQPDGVANAASGCGDIARSESDDQLPKSPVDYCNRPKWRGFR